MIWLRLTLVGIRSRWVFCEAPLLLGEGCREEGVNEWRGLRMSNVAENQIDLVSWSSQQLH